MLVTKQVQGQVQRVKYGKRNGTKITREECAKSKAYLKNAIISEIDKKNGELCIMCPWVLHKCMEKAYSDTNSILAPTPILLKARCKGAHVT